MTRRPPANTADPVSLTRALHRGTDLPVRRRQAGQHLRVDTIHTHRATTLPGSDWPGALVQAL